MRIMARLLAGAFAVAFAASVSLSDDRVAAQTSAAQTPAQRSASSSVPDLQGYWQGSGYATVDEAYDLEKGMPEDERIITGRTAASTANANKGVVIDTPDHKIPYKPWALALRDRLAYNVYHPTRLEDIDSLTRCYQMGMPRQSFLGGFHIVQTSQFVFLVHGNGGARTIALDSRKHLDPKIKLWAGDSIGRWEGNTLIVDVTNINDSGWYDVAGNFHSDELHLIEKWTLVNKDLLRYEVLNTDPRVFTRPWTLRNEYKRVTEEGFEQWENACYEGERGVELMLNAAKKNQQQAPSDSNQASPR